MSKKAIEISNQIAAWIEEKKGTDIQVLDIADLTSLADCFVIASAKSTIQAQAIANFLEEKAQNHDLSLRRKEGHQTGRWILLDYNNVIVHIFHEEERDFYKIERLWQDAEIQGSIK